MNESLPRGGAAAQLRALQPERVHELFQYTRAMLMVESGQGWVVERHASQSGEVIVVCSVDGDLLTVAEPNVSASLLDQMMSGVREIATEGDQ